MQCYEVSALFGNLWMKDKENWEQARMMMYVTAQVNTKKKLTPEKLLKFPWDNKVNGGGGDELTKEKVEALRRQAEEMKKYL